MKTWLIVTPYFAPELEYQEWVLAKGLARLGHRVLVLTKRGEALGLEAERKLSPFPNLQIRRINYLGFRSTFWPFPAELGDWLEGAEGAVLVAPIHGFSYYVGKRLPATLPLTAIFSEFQQWSQPWIAKVYKSGWYRWLFQRCQRLCATTPFGINFIRQKGADRYPDKLRWAPLPFDEEDFYWPPPSERPRSALGQHWLISPTRMNRLKPIALWLRTVIIFLQQHPQWNYRMIGLTDETLRPELDGILRETNMVSRVEIHGLMNGPELLEQYWDADLALYFRPSIGIQQALATGIPLITERRATVVDHLIKEPFNGYFYDEIDGLPKVLATAASHAWQSREALSDFARQWNSRAYVKNVLDL